MYIIKEFDSYFQDTFEINGTIIMINFTSEKEEAKKFNDFDEAISTLNRINCRNAIIEEI